MHKYNKLFFSVLIFLIACKSNKVPNGVIDQGRMTNLLIDIHITDGSMYNIMQVPDSLYKYGSDKYQMIFEKYHTDSAQFRSSFKYYTSHPDKLEAMYEEITKDIKQKTDSVNKLNLAQINRDNKRRTDSLNKLPKQAPPKPVVAEPAKPAPGKKNSHIKPRKNPHVDPIP